MKVLKFSFVLLYTIPLFFLGCYTHTGTAISDFQKSVQIETVLNQPNSIKNIKGRKIKLPDMEDKYLIPIKQYLRSKGAIILDFCCKECTDLFDYNLEVDILFDGNHTYTKNYLIKKEILDINEIHFILELYNCKNGTLENRHTFRSGMEHKTEKYFYFLSFSKRPEIYIRNSDVFNDYNDYNTYYQYPIIRSGYGHTTPKNSDNYQPANESINKSQEKKMLEEMNRTEEDSWR